MPTYDWEADRSSPAAHAAFNARLQRLYGYDGTHAGANAMDQRNGRFLIGSDWRTPELMLAGSVAGGALGAAAIGGGAAAGGGAGGGAAASLPAAGAATSGATAGGATSGAIAPTVSGAGAGAARTGLMSRLGSIFGGRGAETAVNAGVALYGQRSQNNAAREARADLLANQAQQLELERARLAQEGRNADLDRDEQRALNAAMMDLDRRRFALEQETAQFARESEMFDRDQVTQENTRLAPYRQISTSAAQRLASMWGIG